jgi:CRP-like cAMP-binding protein
MTCNPDVLKSVPLFALLDAEESAVLAAQVELKESVPRERIYKQGQPRGQAYVLLSNSSKKRRRWASG